VVGVAMDEEGWQTVKTYLEQHPINYRIVVGDGDFAKLYGVTSLPVTLLIDRRGRIADAHVFLRAVEARLLRKKGASRCAFTRESCWSASPWRSASPAAPPPS